MGTDMKYDAFISYRHTEPDSYVAEILHRQLESFRLPGNVLRSRQAADQEARTRIRRVFRDKEELPLVSNLADPIKEALEQSEFLIVICSPRLNESMWCRKEIETFIQLHDREHVLAVLVEGEPENAFPEELLYREEEILQPDGSVMINKIPVEPLAADVRGKNKKEIREKLKGELLRLVAPMFGCSYDELKQRHREQRIRKMIVTAGAVSAGCLLFGAVSTTMALRIREQNIRITQQAEQLKTQSDKIQEQYREAVRVNCVTRAGTAMERLKSGDRMEALKIALSVFPKGEGQQGEEIPYTAQAAYALTESLRLYANASSVRPDRILAADTTILFAKTSPAGGRILTVDEYGGLVVWDAGTGERIAELLLEEGGLTEEEEVLFLDEDHFWYSCASGVALYDLEQGQNVYQIAGEQLPGMLRSLSCSEEKDLAIIQCQEGFLALRASTGEILWEENWEEKEPGTQLQSACELDPDGALYAVSVAKDSYGEDNRQVRIYNTADRELLAVCEMPYRYVKHLRFADGILYIINNGEIAESEDLFDTSSMRGRLIAYDYTRQNIRWEYEAEGQWLYETSIASAKDSDYMVCTGYDNLYALNRTTGEMLHSFSFGTQVVKLGNYTDSNAFMIFARDGVLHYVNLEQMTDYVGETFSQCNSTNVKTMELGDDYWLTLPYHEKQITLYRRAVSPKAEPLCTFSEQIREAKLNRDGSRLAVSLYRDDLMVDIVVVDTESGETVFSYEEEENYSRYGYFLSMEYCEYGQSGQEGLMVILSKDILLLDAEKGIVLAEYPHGEEYTDDNEEIAGITCEDGMTVVYTAYEGMLHRYMLEDSRILKQDLEFEDLEERNGLAVNEECFAYTTRVDDCLHIWNWDAQGRKIEEGTALKSNRESCRELARVEDINAAYVESVFFTEDQKLFVIYRNGDARVFTLQKKQGEKWAVTETEGYTDLEESLCAGSGTAGKTYGFLKGRYDGGYLTTPEGELTAHVEGALAIDTDRDILYQEAGNTVNRVPVYTEEEIRNEAASQLTLP